MAIAEKLQNIINEKQAQIIMTNYGLPSGSKINSSTKFIDYPKYIFNAFLEALRTPDTLFTNLPKKSGSGSVISLNDTANAPMRIELGASELTQDGTPTPSSPQAVHTISGSNTIKVEGKNLFDINSLVKPTAEQTATGSFIDNGIRVVLSTDGQYKYASWYIDNKVIKNWLGKNMYISCNATPSASNNGRILLRLFNKATNGMGSTIANLDATGGMFTMPSSLANDNLVLLISFYANQNSATHSTNDYVDYTNIQIEYGSTATSYEPYISQEAEVDLSSKNLFTTRNNFSMITGYANYNVLDTNSLDVISTGNSYGYRYVRYQLNGLEVGKTYYVSAKFENSDKTTTSPLYIRNTADSSSLYANDGYTSGSKVSFTATETTAMIRFYASGGTAKINTCTWYNIMVSQDQNADFMPYYEPIQYCKIGTYEDKFIRTSGSNLFDVNEYQNLSTTYEYNLNNYHIKKIQLEPNTDYTISHNASSSSSVVILMNNVQQVNSSGYYDLRNASGSKTFTTDSTGCLYIGVLYTATDTDYNNRINSCELVINKGTTALPYEPYGSNEWYIKKNIGKVVLDGTENWGTIGDNRYYLPFTDKRALTSAVPCLLKSNYFKATNNAGDSVGIGEMTEGYYTGGNINVFFNYNGGNSDLAGFKTWLGTNKPLVYYILNNPTYTQITGTLETQLENIYQKLLSYSGTTNISQVNNDLSFVFDVEAVEGI